MASQNSDYVTLSGGQSNIETYTTLTGASASKGKTDGGEVTLTLGHKYEDSARFSASFQLLNKSDSVKSAGTFTMAYDALFPISTSGLTLFVGPLLGYTQYETSLNNLNGLHYGAEAGALFEFADCWAVELGYKYFKESASEQGSLAKVEFDNMQTFYFGASYYFSYE
jgi:hypothetical protein